MQIYGDNPDIYYMNQYLLKKFINEIHNTNILILNGKIEKRIKTVFENVVVLYLINCEKEFIFDHFNRFYFPNVKRIYWLNKSIIDYDLLFNFNLYYNSLTYDVNLCEIFIDSTYTTNSNIINNNTNNHHIRLVSNLYEYIITNFEKNDYFIKDNQNINLTLYNKFFNEWNNKK